MSPTAYAYSGGAWYDSKDKHFKLWYSAHLDVPGGDYGMWLQCLAVSQDGIHWEKPAFDVEEGTNIVLRQHHDSTTVWLDHNETAPTRRFKYFSTPIKNSGTSLTLFYSPDGIHWTDSGHVQNKGFGDRTTCFYNPFRKVWVGGLRHFFGHGVGRARSYIEAETPQGVLRNTSKAVPWCGADKLDPHNPRPEYSKIEPQLYNLDAVAYESIMLGMFASGKDRKTPQ